MKNEVLARAITELDDDLIADAHTGSAAIRVHSKRIRHTAFAVAACFVLLISGALLRVWQNHVEIFSNGSLLDDQAIVLELPSMASPDARQTEPASLTIPLEIDANGKVEIEALDGTLALCDAAANEPIESGTRIQTSGSVTIQWTIPHPAERATYHLKINHRTLVLSAQDNQWVIAPET